MFISWINILHSETFFFPVLHFDALDSEELETFFKAQDSWIWFKYQQTTNIDFEDIIITKKRLLPSKVQKSYMILS